MSLFTDSQLETVQKLFVKGFEKAAESLSQYLSEHVIPGRPMIMQIRAAEAEQYLKNLSLGWSSNISQFFDGNLKGISILSFKKKSSKELLKLLLGETSDFYDGLTDIDRITLCEIGNSLINATLGTTNNLFNGRFKLNYSLPVFHENITTGAIRHFIVKEKSENFIIINEKLKVVDHDIVGNILIIIDYFLFENFLRKIETYDFEFDNFISRRIE